MEKNYSKKHSNQDGHTGDVIAQDIGLHKEDVPIWRRYALTIDEAAKYFRIGERKMRKLVEDNRDSIWVVMNGNRSLILRKHFEKFLDESSVV